MGKSQFVGEGMDAAPLLRQKYASVNAGKRWKMAGSYLKKVVGVRLGVREFGALRGAAAIRGLRVSQLIRQILLEWLSSHNYLPRKSESSEAEGEK